MQELSKNKLRPATHKEVLEAVESALDISDKSLQDGRKRLENSLRKYKERAGKTWTT